MYFLNFNDGFVEVPFASPSLNIYTVGCEHKCNGCHAKDLQDINHENRQILTFELLEKKLNSIPGFYKSVCWLGGDPFFQFKDCYNISKLLKEKFPNIVNIVYTGYDWIQFYNTNILNNDSYLNPLPFDFIIDGKWNGKMLGENGCNQKIWYKCNNLIDIKNNYVEITYDKFKSGVINE
jgi:anaerobic ribonucleoside-triphosphate reductase activating protein